MEKLQSQPHSNSPEESSSNHEASPTIETPRRTKQKLGRTALKNTGQIPTEPVEAVTDSTDEAAEPARPVSIEETNSYHCAEARYYADQLADIETAFASQLKRQRERGQTTISQTEFELWEQEFSSNWRRHSSELGKLRQISGQDHDIATASSESGFLVSCRRLGNQTIEVQAGHFYAERARALKDAISNSDDPRRDHDLDRLGELYGHALEHIDYKYETVYGMSYTEALSYYRRRALAHDELIRNLNDVNDLARKYGTKPLTPRNFWPSSDRNLDPGVQDRMSCDRDIVESYCAVAFNDMETRARQKWERERDLH